MAAISQRGQGGRIYNNTRTREPLRRKCVKPADLTAHFPSKICSRPRTATRPARAFSHSLPAHFRSPAPRRCTPADLTTHSPPKTFARPLLFRFGHKKNGTAQWMCDAFPADLTTHSPPKTFARPRTTTPPSRALSHSLPAPTHTRRLRDTFPAEGLRPPQHSDTPSPSIFSPPSRTLPPPSQRRCTPAALTTHSPPKTFARPRSATLPPLPFRFGHKKTAPHCACAMPNVSVDRRCGRSFGLVSRALFAAVAGRWRVGVGLRPQPWALRSRRCGRVLRA